jgi:hypothetical protein
MAVGDTGYGLVAYDTTYSKIGKWYFGVMF